MVVAINGIAFGVCLAMAGRPGDNFGRRQLFGIGRGAVRRCIATVRTGRFDLGVLVARTSQEVGAAWVVLTSRVGDRIGLSDVPAWQTGREMQCLLRFSRSRLDSDPQFAAEYASDAHPVRWHRNEPGRAS